MNKQKIIVYIVSLPLLVSLIVPALVGSIWFTTISIVFMPLGFTIGDFKTFADWYNSVVDVNMKVCKYLFRILEDV